MMKTKTAPQFQSLWKPEWAPQKAMWTAWPSHPDLWPGGLLAQARDEIAAMVRLISDGQNVKVLAEGQEAVESARDLMGTYAEIFDVACGDIWLRDTGPIFVGDKAYRFRTNGWGGKYIYDGDDMVGDFVAGKARKEITRFDFILEGGALENNGAGVLMTTRQCMLNPNRNPGWDEAAATKILLEAFSAERIIWLDDGLLNDHTDGHVDNLARFVAEDTVACPVAFGADDPNAAMYDKTARDIAAQGMNVVRVPSPGLFMDDQTGDIAPASHMNFIIGNKAVAVPTYGTASADEAVSVIAELFPGRVVKGLPAGAILTGGGSFHCITQQEPEV